MAIKRVAGLAAATVLLTALAALASQPAVRLSDLKPAAMADTSNALTLLLVDPWAESEFRIEPVRGYSTLDVDADPFAVASR